jgi:molybdopterin-guanine dinucleotide biosynthesis protein A
MDGPAHDDLSKVTLAVIAGGSGRCMGSPKARLHIDGKSILRRLLDGLQWPGPTMVVSAPATANLLDAKLFDMHCTDPVDGLGPLRGVLTALENSTTPTVAAIAVDMPAINKEMLTCLVQSLQARPDCNGLMFCVPRREGQEIEPFPSVFRADAAKSIIDRFGSGNLSLHGLCDSASFLAVAAPADWSEELWTNLNDPAQFAAYEQKNSC